MKSSAMYRLCPSGDGDEVPALDEPETGGELSNLRPHFRPGDGAESERAGVVARPLDGHDRDSMDPLAELAWVDVDEGGERSTRCEQLTRERLPGGPGAPDDRRSAAGEQRPT